jgi:hypothetical protein
MPPNAPHQFNPHCAEAFNNLGVLHKERGNLEKAMQCYMSALQVRIGGVRLFLLELRHLGGFVLIALFAFNAFTHYALPCSCDQTFLRA